MAETIKGVKVKISVDNKQAQTGLKKTESSIKSLGKSAIGLGAAFLSFRAIGSIVSNTTATFIEQERVIAQLEASLKSTGNQIGITSAEFQQMASSLQKVTTFGDEQIISAQSMLLTFTKIGKDVFPEVIERTLDLSAKMGQDLKSSVVQLGKALNDPVANLGALSRTGIQFTKDQKEMIKGLWEAGKAAEAQAIILEELNTQFGGSAQAEAETYGGKLKQISNEFGDIGETIGSVIVPVMVALGEALLTVLDPLREMSKEYDILRGKLIDLNVAGRERNTEFLKFSKSEREELKKITEIVTTRYDVETEKLKKRMKQAVDSFKIREAEALKEKITIRESERLNNILQHSHDILNTQLKKNTETQKKKQVVDKESIKTNDKKEKSIKKTTLSLKKEKSALDELFPPLKEVRMEWEDFVDQGLVPGVKPIEQITNNFDEMTESVDNLGDGLEELSDLFSDFVGLADGLGNLFETLGLDTAVQGFKDLASSMDSFSNIAKDIASGNVIGAITGAVNYLSDALKKNDAYFAQINDTISDLYQEGLLQDFLDNVVDTTDRINGIVGKTETAGNLQTGLEGYVAYLNGEFSDVTFDVYEKMLEKQTQIAENKGLIEGIKGLVIAMKNFGEVSEDEFDKFEKSTRDGYDALLKAGFSGSDALEQILPNLKELQELQKKYNVTIDEGTQALIDEAIANGMLKPDPIERMADAMETFIDLLSKQLGLATKTAGDDLDNLGKNIIGIGNKWNGLNFKQFPDIGGKDIPKFSNGADFTVPQGFDNDTFPMMVSSGEDVKVTPKGQTNNESVGNQNIKIEIYPAKGDSEFEIADKVISAYRKNTNNIKGELSA